MKKQILFLICLIITAFALSQFLRLYKQKPPSPTVAPSLSPSFTPSPLPGYVGYTPCLEIPERDYSYNWVELSETEANT